MSTAIPPQKKRQNPRQSRKVLLIEDNPSVFATTKNLLQFDNSDDGVMVEVLRCSSLLDLECFYSDPSFNLDFIIIGDDFCFSVENKVLQSGFRNKSCIALELALSLRLFIERDLMLRDSDSRTFLKLPLILVWTFRKNPDYNRKT